MKKVLAIIFAVSILLSGCSKEGKGFDKISQNPVANKPTDIASSSDEETISPQSENTLSQGKDGNDASSKLIDDMDITKSQFEKGYYDYKGIINNNIPLQMSIYQTDKDVVGTYFYDKQRIEINLKGKAGEKDIVLNEYDETGKNTGIFQGTMKTVDKIKGTWISGDGTKEYPFELILKSSIPGAEYGKRYGLAVDSKSDKDVEDFVTKIQTYALNDNKEKLAEEVAYPIKVKINGSITSMANKEEFIRNYNEIFHSDYKHKISNAYTKYLFVNYQGIMFGEGLYNMWINSVSSDNKNFKLMITAINN